MENLLVKQELYNKCVRFINSRLQTIQNKINEIEESLLSETKSSAGDKHETGRAMLQLEREKSGNQLAEIVKVKEGFSKVSVENTSNVIVLGSVVYTTQRNYFIAISAGELQVKNDMFFAISPNTPIGKLLLGKTVDDKVVFRNSNFLITKAF